MEVDWGGLENFRESDLEDKNFKLPIPIILEEDSISIGEFEYNLCVSGVLSKSDFTTMCVSSQVVGENGEWWGSQKADLPDEVKDLIQDKIQPLLEYWRNIGYVGPVGPDCIVFRNTEGELDLRWIDPNARNPISMIPEVMSNKLNLPVWRNTNITFNEAITDFNQISPLIKEIESQVPNCKIIPLAFRSTSQNPSPVCKIGIFTENQESLDQAFAILSQTVTIGS